MTRGEKRQGHSSPPANAVLVLEGSTSAQYCPLYYSVPPATALFPSAHSH